jgi:F420H(2)-dependent quinone reductase
MSGLYGPSGVVSIIIDGAGIGKFPAFGELDAAFLPQPATDMVRHLTSQFYCWWSRIGLPPRFLIALEVRHRTTGQPRQDAVVVSEVAGEQYIVSMFGSISDWVHNLEASRGEAAIYQGRAHRVRLTLVPIEERAPIIKEFNRIALSGRKHLGIGVDATLEDCAAIAPYHPAYKIEWLDNSNE